MRPETRARYNREWADGVARMNFTTDIESNFTVDPTVQQRMYTKMQESADFLKAINVLPVDEQSGEKAAMGIYPNTIASRIDTTTGERKPADPIVLGSQTYHCKQTNFDTVISYGKLDTFASHPDFAVRIRDTILRRKALDIIMTGFNGTHAAADTDRDANPLLQDVNIGWLAHIEEQFPERVIPEVVPESLQVTVGEGGNYRNIDALVWDAFSLIPDELKEGAERYVAIMSSHLLSDRSRRLFEAAGNKPSEIEAAQLVASSKKVAGLNVVAAPFMPRKSVLITPLSNLSIYYQAGKDRRRIVDNAKRDQIENYESSNLAYVVEDFEKVVLIQNINRLDVSDWNDDAAYA